jgi:uncharacterized protein
VLYTIGATSFHALHRRLIYRPQKKRFTPEDAGLTGFEETHLDTPDGHRLVAWYGPAAEGGRTILYFKGRRGGLITRSKRTIDLTASGFGMFLLGYRGYAGSTGKPTEKALVDDGLLAYDHLLSLGVKPDDIIIYGEGLGASVACQVARQREACAVILEAPLSGYADFALKQYGVYTIKRFLSEQHHTADHIRHITAPILILQAGRDNDVPIRFVYPVYDAATGPKDMVVFKGAQHGAVFYHGALEHIQTFLKKYAPYKIDEAESVTAEAV